MTIKDLEHIEMCAQRGLPVDPELILMLTAYVRETLQAKAIAEAIASEAIRVTGVKSGKYAASASR